MMLALFEDEVRPVTVKDVMCASCIGTGVGFITGVICAGCGGAGWLVLGNHEPPCAACNDPRRASRPEPPGLREAS